MTHPVYGYPATATPVMPEMKNQLTAESAKRTWNEFVRNLDARNQELFAQARAQQADPNLMAQVAAFRASNPYGYIHPHHLANVSASPQVNLQQVLSPPQTAARSESSSLVDSLVKSAANLPTAANVSSGPTAMDIADLAKSAIAISGFATPSTTKATTTGTSTAQPAKAATTTATSSGQAKQTGGTTTKGETVAPQGTSTMQPISYYDVQPHQYNYANQRMTPLAYSNGQATREHTFANGQPLNFTNNPFFNNGSDPTHAAWAGLNSPLDAPLSMTQQAALAKILSGSYGNLARMRGLQAQSSIQEAVNNPMVWDMTKNYMSQGMTLDEARNAATTQMLEAQGHYGAMHQVLPEYKKAADERTAGLGMLAMTNGYNYDVQPYLYGIPNSGVTSYKMGNDGATLQLGSTQFDIPTADLPDFVSSMAATPYGQGILHKMMSGQPLTQQERAWREAEKQRLIKERQIEVANVKAAHKDAQITKSADESIRASNAKHDHKKNSNVAGSGNNNF